MPKYTYLPRQRTLRTARLTTILAAGIGGLLTAAPASAQSLCTLLPGGIINCPPPVVPPPAPLPPVATPIVNATASPDPLVVTLADGFVSNGPVVLGTLAGADVNIVSQGVSTINSVGPGLVVNSGRDLTAEVTNITTVGDGATGALLRAADDLIFTSDGAITTAGANAPGVDAQGRTVTLDLGTVTTTGPNAAGVQTVALGGPTSVTFDVIDTSGDNSLGAIIRGTGDTRLSGNAIRTGGTDAAAFDISNDAAACVVLGAGGCDNTVTLDEVTTDGFGSTGGIVSAVGDTNVNIGVLRTGGDEAAGLDLSADPTACAVLGVGGCDTAFTVQNLTTSGARSPGAVVRGAGDITANVGVLRTGGDQAAGLDLASDPTACALLGAGGCDTSFNVGQLTTNGDGATGVLVRSAGDTTGRVGVLRTSGDNAAGIDIASNPTACVIAGVGACDVGIAADDIQTSGDGAAGVLIDNAGVTNADIGRITTLGDGSTGLGITQSPAACLALGPSACRVRARTGPVTTAGDNAPGVSIASPGDTGLVTGPITTGGDNSDAIRIVGGDAPVTVDAGAIVTTGADSDGIDVTTANGNITIAAGPIGVSGLGSDAIVATSVCGNIDITARDDIVSAQGTAILASTGCGVRVTTLPGAPVRGALAGIDVTSGTGAVLTIGDNVTATAGPAIDVDGASAAILVTPTGSITGRVDLTDNADTLTNGGLLDFTGNSDFGAGTDLLTNNATLRARGLASLARLERLANNGLVNLVDGAPDDVLTVSGDFAGGAGSRLNLDFTPGVTGTPADRLVIGGAVSGTTAITLNPVGTGPAVVNAAGTLVVDATTVSPGAFVLAGPTRRGLVDYSLSTQGGAVRLLALPNQLAIEPLLLSRMGLDFWYQSADAWSEGAAHRRNALGSGRAFGAWAEAYGSYDTRGQDQVLDLFGTASTVDLEYETKRTGIQAGVDFGGSGAIAFGLTGGYARAETDFASGTQSIADGYNIGGYVLWGRQTGFYGEVIAKVDFFDVDPGDASLFGNPDIGGTSYGAEGELGYRFLSSGGARIDVNAGLAYVRTDLDGFDVPGGRFDFSGTQSLRGRLGARITGEGTHYAPFGDVKIFHEFMDADDASFASGGFTLPFTDAGRGTWARVEAGFGASGQGAGLFVSAWGELGDVKGLGARLGFRF